MPEWWPLIFLIFSNWPGVTRDTFPLLHFPLRSCCRGPVSPLFEEVHHLFEVVDAVFPLHVHQDAVRSRLHGDVQEGVDAGVVQDLGHFLVPWWGRGEKWGYERLLSLFFTYLQSKCFYLCSFSMPALLCDHKPKWTDWIGRLMKGTELCDGEATLGGSLPPLNGPTQVPLTFLPAAAPVFVDLLQLDGLPLSALSLFPCLLSGGREKGRNSFTLNSSCTHFIQSQAVKVAPKVSFHDRQVKPPLLLRRRCATQNKRMNGKGKKDN